MSKAIQEPKENGQAWILQDFSCSKCGGSLEDGYQERDHGTDRETGYRDIELVCLKCQGCRSCGAECAPCLDCDCCSSCCDCDRQDILAVAKASIEDADLQECPF